MRFRVTAFYADESMEDRDGLTRDEVPIAVARFLAESVPQYLMVQPPILEPGDPGYEEPYA